MKLIDRISIDADMDRDGAVEDLYGVLMERVERVFADHVVQNSRKAYFVYAQGFADSRDEFACRAIGVARARGVDLHEALHLFAEAVEDGARDQLDKDDEAMSLGIEVEDDDFAPGVRIAVTTRFVDHPYRWELQELPQLTGDGWEALGRERAKCTKRARRAE